MRASHLILILVALTAVAGGTIAAQLVTAHSAPDLGEPVVVRPSDPPTATPTRRPRSTPPPKTGPPSGPSTQPQKGHADPVTPCAPAAGDDDAGDDDRCDDIGDDDRGDDAGDDNRGDDDRGDVDD